MSTSFALGLDIGGTKLYAGVVNLDTGEIVGSSRKKTRPERGVDFFTRRMLEVTKEAIAAAPKPASERVNAIGVGIAGQIDRKRGVLLSGPNLGKGLDNLPLRTLLGEALSLPVVVGNDVEAATHGERQFGAGRDTRDFICVFVGTGIGAGIVTNGVLRAGATGTAGEVGHMVVDYGGRLCGCGGRGHLEAYASRTAITRVLLAELGRGRASKLRDEMKEGETVIRSGMLARTLEQKDALTLEALTEAADYLGAGLGSVATIYNPERIIVGGGLIEAVPYFLARATERARESALPVVGRALNIVKTGLGDDAGVVGAAWMAATSGDGAR
jgi:glucokinase